jgi:predicted amidohydrolase
MRYIIVPTDFSAPRAAALRFATYLSRVTSLTVRAVYTYNPMVVSNRPDTAEEREEEKRLLGRELDHYVDKHITPAPDLPPVQTTVVEGIAALTIRELSQSDDTALIVVGGGEAEAEGQDDFYGKIVRELAREGGCPVLFIPAHYGNRMLHDAATLLHRLRNTLAYPSERAKNSGYDVT